MIAPPVSLCSRITENFGFLSVERGIGTFSALDCPAASTVVISVAPLPSALVEYPTVALIVALEMKIARTIASDTVMPGLTPTTTVEPAGIDTEGVKKVEFLTVEFAEFAGKDGFSLRTLSAYSRDGFNFCGLYVIAPTLALKMIG